MQQSPFVEFSPLPSNQKTGSSPQNNNHLQPEPKKLKFLSMRDSQDSDWGSNVDSPIEHPSNLANRGGLNDYPKITKQEVNSCPNQFFKREIEPSSVSNTYSYQPPATFVERDKTAAQPIRREKKKRERQQVSSQAISWV